MGRVGKGAVVRTVSPVALPGGDEPPGATGGNMKIFVLVIHPWDDNSAEVRGAYSTLDAAIRDGKRYGPPEAGDWHVEEYTLNVYNAGALVPYRYE